MGGVIGQNLILALAVGLSPIPIIGIILMLATPTGSTNGLAFLLGWVVGLTALGTIVLVTASGADSSSDAPDWANIARIAAGAALLLLALKQWRGRPRPGEEAKLPAWMDKVDHFTVRHSLMLGFALAAINPKNLVLVVAAATTIAQASISNGQQAIALGLFILIGTIGTGVPIILYLTMRERSEDFLLGLKGWMTRNNAVIMAALLLLIGANLIWDGIKGFSG